MVFILNMNHETKKYVCAFLTDLIRVSQLFYSANTPLHVIITLFSRLLQCSFIFSYCFMSKRLGKPEDLFLKKKKSLYLS